MATIAVILVLLLVCMLHLFHLRNSVKRAMSAGEHYVK